MDVGAIFEIVGCKMSSTKLFKVNLATESNPVAWGLTLSTGTFP